MEQKLSSKQILELQWVEAPQPLTQPKRDDRWIEERRRDVELELVRVLNTPMSQFELKQVSGRVNLVRYVPKLSYDPVLPILFPISYGKLDDIKYRNAFNDLSYLAQLLDDWSWSQDWISWTKAVDKSIKSLVKLSTKVITVSEQVVYERWMRDICLSKK